MNTYILVISLIINAALLMAVLGIIPFLLYFSVLINLALLWWSSRMISDMKDVESDVDTVLRDVDDFRQHLEKLYELEMYYGDETLASLIDHSRDTVNSILDFSYKHSLEIREIEEEEEFAENEEKEE